MAKKESAALRDEIANQRFIDATTTLQATWRMTMAKKEFAALRDEIANQRFIEATTTLQATWRMTMAKKESAALRDAGATHTADEEFVEDFNGSEDEAAVNELSSDDTVDDAVEGPAQTMGTTWVEADGRSVRRSLRRSVRLGNLVSTGTMWVEESGQMLRRSRRLQKR